MKKKVLFCDYPQAMDESYAWQREEILRAYPDADVRVVSYASPQQLRAELAQADALVTAFLPLTREVLAAAPRLRIVSVHATGYGNVNVDAARDLGIAVTHVADYCTEEVAEHTMALMLALARHLKAYDHHVNEGFSWQFESEKGLHRLCGRHLMLFGWGRISRRVAKLSQAFGMEVGVVSHHLTDDAARTAGVRSVTKEEAFAEGEILSNHMAEARENYHFFRREAFDAMKRTPIFLNVGRGSAVDEAALVEALDAGKIAGAGLDVLQTENPDLAHSPLIGRPNVILTPHAAFYSEESHQELAARAVQNILDFFAGKPVKNLAAKKETAVEGGAA